MIKQSYSYTSAQQSYSVGSSESNQKHLRLIPFKINQISRKFTKIRTRGYYSLILVFLLAQLPLIKADSELPLPPPPPPVPVSPVPPASPAISTCNSFPKIFGGSQDHSYLNQIDVYNDYLAMGGHTYDNSITGMPDSTSIIPYVALQSISTGGKFYWAKALSLKTWNSIGAVQFSTDGALLIVHSNQDSCFILVFNTSSGNVLSARSYSTGGYYNYNNRVKSILVSSGASSMAYVLSDYNVGGSCTGQQLFKIDPLAFSSVAVWIKQTLGTTNCGHLGLVFGRSELFLYAFSWQGSLSTVSLLDTDGNSKWQYSTPDGNNQFSNSIKYKQIDVSTDMVIATSGYSYINYNRIISQSTSPYTVSSSQTLRDPTSNSNLQLYGLYIKDQNNAVSLIYDSSSQHTDLATIDFIVPSISYQRAFPKIINFRTAFFTSPTLYYAGGYYDQFYYDQTTSYKDLNSKIQSIVYSSSVTTTSCYSMAPIVTPAPITMTPPSTSITSLSASIYEPSTVTFVDDTQAYTTVDIVQSQITSINSWCRQTPPFTVNNVTQSNNTFTVQRSATAQSLPITPFSATLNCGSYATTWTYTGVKTSDGNALNTNQISVNSKSGSIKVQSMLIGNYSIKVIGTLPDLITTFSADFIIIITGIDPPYFTGEQPQNQRVMINTELFYTLPPFIDPEDSPVKISFKPDMAHSFVSIQDKTVKFAPKQSFQVGTTQITIILTNQQNSSSNSSFNVTVFSPPEFTEKLQRLDIAILSQANYSLPVNKESNYYVFHSSGLPRFVKFEYPHYFFSPEKSSDIGNFIISGELCDQNAKTRFQLKISVTNKAPYLLQGKISDLRVTVESEYIFTFSEGVDREGQKIKYEANERNSKKMPQFIKFNPVIRQFRIQPTKLDAIKDYNYLHPGGQYARLELSYCSVEKESEKKLTFTTRDQASEMCSSKLSTENEFPPIKNLDQKGLENDFIHVIKRIYHIELNLIDEFNARNTYPFVVNIINPGVSNQTNQVKTKIKKPISIEKSYLSAKIKSISPYGVVVIKFSDELDTPIFINNASLKFNSSNMDVQLKPFVDQNEQNKNKSIAKWDAINLTTTELTIKVNFTDPALISPKITQEDQIEIIFRDGELLRSTRGQKNLPDDYVLLTGLPRQIFFTKQIATLYDIVTSGSKTMTYVVIGNIALQLFLSFSMHLLWGMMNNLQLITAMLKFNINVPSNAYIFFKYVDEFLSMKAQFIENYLEKFNSYIMKTTQQGGQSDKDANSSIIKNLGTIILGLVAIVLAMIITALLIKYSRIPLVMKITDALKNKLFYNSILRTGVQSYLKFSIIAFSSLDSYKDKTTLATGIVFLCLTVFFIFFAHFFLRKNQAVLSEPNFQQRFNSLYLNIETDIPHSYLLTTIFLARRFLLGIVLSLADNHQDAQFFFMNFTSFLIIIYLVKVRPLVSKYLNAIEIFNEVILYGCTGLIWGMTDYQSHKAAEITSEQFDAAYNSKQNQIGWAYIIMASTTILMTIGGIIINFLLTIRTKLQKKCQNQNKAVKEQQPARSQEYELQKQDDSTLMQNKSEVSIIDQGHPSQQIVEEIKDQKFLTPSEYKSKLEKMNEIIKNIQSSPQQLQIKKSNQIEALAAREELFSMLKQQSELTKIVYDLATAIPKEN